MGVRRAGVTMRTVARLGVGCVVAGVVLAFMADHNHALAQATCPGMAEGRFKFTPYHHYKVLHGAGPVASILLRLEKYKVGPRFEDEHSAIEVNSDGSPRAYHLLDPEGRKFALNDMYSGGVKITRDGDEIDAAAGPNSYKRYYDTFRTMVADNIATFGVEPSTYKAKDDSVYNLGGDFGLNLDEPKPPTVAFERVEGKQAERAKLRPRGLSTEYLTFKCKEIDCEVAFPKNIFLFKDGKLCIRKKGRYAGFLVNRLSIDALVRYPAAGNEPDPENAEDTECGLPVNVDAEKVPGFVLPGRGISVEGTGQAAKMGDIVIAYNPEKLSWVFGIISDGGPGGDRIGEASLAFNRILKGGGYLHNPIARPERYRRAFKGDTTPIVLSHSVESKVMMLVLPGSAQRLKMTSGDTAKFDYSPKTIAAEGKKAFLEWAAVSDLAAARKKFRACVSALER